MSLSPFSQRVRSHPRIAEQWPFPRPFRQQVLAANDELLVSQSASRNADVKAWLTANARNGAPVTTVFEDLPSGGGEDVEIWELPPNQDVYAATDHLRTILPAAEGHKVAPNHVVVPAGNGDQCPSGAPRETARAPRPAERRLAERLVEAIPVGDVAVTVIDSGYQWDAAKWGRNPLEDLCVLSTHPGPAIQVGQWTDSAPDEPDADGDTNLDALAGHANFVAGVIAQALDQPTISIWNHNGGFSWEVPEIPLEAAVCRSILMSQTPPKGTPTDVIHVGFSFAVYKNRPHHMWELLLRRLSGKVIVAPAGNQGRGHERYPAALHRQHPTSVIGVGSLQPGLTNRSKFSNYGKWVACSAVGEDVESTFLEVDMPPEENPRLPHNYAQNSWALWNGTSFSAPKVAAVMAALMRQGQAPAQAWTTLTGVTNRRSSSLGHLFQV